jgi:hypothetical protein
VILFAFPTQVYGYSLLAEARHRAMLLSVLAALGTTGCGLSLLTGEYGAAGAATALAAGQAVLLAGYLLAYGRRHGLQGHGWPAMVGTAGFAMAVAAAVTIDNDLLAAVVSVLLAALVVGLPALRAVRDAVRRSS